MLDTFAILQKSYIFCSLKCLLRCLIFTIIKCSAFIRVCSRFEFQVWHSNKSTTLTTDLKLGFPTGRDSAIFRDSGTGKKILSQDKGTMGQKFLHCPGTKGQRDKLEILPRDRTGRAGTAKIRDGMDQDSQKPGQDKGQNGTEQKRMF